MFTVDLHGGGPAHPRTCNTQHGVARRNGLDMSGQCGEVLVNRQPCQLSPCRLRPEHTKSSRPGLGCSSVTENLPSMCKVMGSSHTLEKTKTKQNKKKFICSHVYRSGD